MGLVPLLPLRLAPGDADLAPCLGQPTRLAMRVVSVAGVVAVAAGVIVGVVNLASLCPWLLRVKVGVGVGASRRARV